MNRLLLLTLIVFASCGPAPTGGKSPGPGRLRPVPLVIATLHPLEYFAERIAGEWVETEGYYAHDPSDADALARLQSADLILLGGAGREGWTSSASLPMARTLDTSDGFHARLIHTQASAPHSHGSGPEHVHHGLDPFTWVDPRNSIDQASAILEAIVGLLPEREAALRERFAALESDLAALDEELVRMSEENPTILVSHPSYEYLGKRYGFRFESLDLDPTRELDDAARQRVRSVLDRDTPIRILLWTQPPVFELDRELTEMGVAGSLFTTCETPDELPRGQDYLEAQRSNLARLSELLH